MLATLAKHLNLMLFSKLSRLVTHAQFKDVSDTVCGKSSLLDCCKCPDSLFYTGFTQ